MQTLALINIECIKISRERITINTEEPIKTSKSGKAQPTLHLAFFDKRKICPSQTLVDYLHCTKDRRNNEKSSFLSLKKPYGKVGASTLSRWIKIILTKSGMDTETFSGYSTSHAAKRAKRAGVNIDTIRATAGWTKASKTYNLQDFMI